MTLAEQKEIVNKIKFAVKNPTTIHILDEQRVACIFYNSFKTEEVAYDSHNIGAIINALPSSYSEYTKGRIRDIAQVVSYLPGCSEI